MPASQAGRRGFDSRLPLHLFNSLGKLAKTDIPLYSIKVLHDLFWTLRRLQEIGFELHCRSRQLVQARNRVLVQIDPDSVPHLIRNNFAIRSSLAGKTGIGPPHHLEARPPEPNFCELGLDVASPQVVS